MVTLLLSLVLIWGLVEEMAQVKHGYMRCDLHRLSLLPLHHDGLFLLLLILVNLLRATQHVIGERWGRSRVVTPVHNLNHLLVSLDVDPQQLGRGEDPVGATQQLDLVTGRLCGAWRVRQLEYDTIIGCGILTCV